MDYWIWADWVHGGYGWTILMDGSVYMSGDSQPGLVAQAEMEERLKAVREPHDNMNYK